MDTSNDESTSDPHDDCFEAAKALLDNPAHILNAIMMSMGDGLSIQDRNMRIVYQNKFLIDHFGSHVGEYCYNIYEKRSTACEGCPIIASYSSGQITKSLRTGITKEGTPFRFENIASVLKNEQGEIVAGMELCRLVEEREKAFDDLRDAMLKLKQMQDQLVRAEKLAGIGQLAAGVAHEINNPASFVLSNLNTMSRYISDLFSHIESVESLAKSAHKENATALNPWQAQPISDSDDYRYLKDELPEIIAESLTGLKRIKNIVTHLLTFASSDEKQYCEVNINSEVELALLLLDNEIVENPQITMKLGKIPLITGNPQQLQQVFVNLIRNAMQAIGPNGGISVTTELIDDYISVAISDNGIGIATDVMPNIFNPFFTTRDVGKGIGLGLSIAYRIIENHKGTIDVQSTPGHGTTFTLRLPCESFDDSPTDTII